MHTRAPPHVVGVQPPLRPLVSPEHVKGHLRLLRIFRDFRTIVEDCKDSRIPRYAMQMDKDARWCWFVRLAVERFEAWVKSLKLVPLEKFVADHIPPLDVWMVWHAYMLSPSWYAEDCERLEILKQLRWLNTVVGSIKVGKVVLRNPSNARVEAWHKQTGIPFDPFEAMTTTEDTLKQFECPRCRTRVYVPIVNRDSTRFIREKFVAMCPLPGCGLKITHDNLAIAKFLRDLSDGDDVAREHFVAGSLFVPSGRRDVRHARVIKDMLLRSVHLARLRPSTLNERLVALDRVQEVKKEIGYSLERLKEVISTSLRNCPPASVARILSAYNDGSPFSINLVDAVLRQSNFTAQMDELGWLKRGAFREAGKCEILEHSVMRYHAFLDLTAAYPNSMLVPTLDIDLVWHTHQLMASRYSVDCEMYVGHLVEHELSITESRLSSAFDATCRAWQTRFQTPYMQCGCPSVPDETCTPKLVRLVWGYMRGRSELQMDLHPEHLPATHPSAHNALLTFQTVGTGTFGKMHRHANTDTHSRREKRSRAATPERARARKRSERLTQLHVDLEWLPPMHRSPAMVQAYFKKEHSVLPKQLGYLKDI